MSFSVSGCEIVNDYLGKGSEGGENPEPEYIPPEELVDGAADTPSIKEKFGIEAEGTDGVAAAFNALSAYIQGGGLSWKGNVIRLGDWIDLEGGLKVEVYGTGNYIGGFTASNSTITPSPVPFEGYEGKLLRLIVVGINSFHSGRGVKDNADKTPTENGEINGQYNQTDNDDTPHVVFQFQNLLVKRRMNPDGTNVGGYPASEMRKYLIPTGDDNSGQFLLGLTNAGVPEGVLWAPKRYVSARETLI